jgi:hypothetical protein
MVYDSFSSLQAQVYKALIQSLFGCFHTKLVSAHFQYFYESLASWSLLWPGAAYLAWPTPSGFFGGSRARLNLASNQALFLSTANLLFFFGIIQPWAKRLTWNGGTWTLKSRHLSDDSLILITGILSTAWRLGDLKRLEARLSWLRWNPQERYIADSSRLHFRTRLVAVMLTKTGLRHDASEPTRQNV